MGCFADWRPITSSGNVEISGINDLFENVGGIINKDETKIGSIVDSGYLRFH